MNKIKKIWWVIERNAIKLIDGFNPRLYMKNYNRYLRKIGIDMKGVPRFIHPTVVFDGKGYDRIHIGDNVVISRDTLLLIHDYSITCGLRSVGDEIEHEAYWINDINIGNNVFIGAKCTILPGSNIGDNCIIGAGTVIKGKILPNSIYTGNPAKKFADIKEWVHKKKKIGDYYFERSFF